VRFEIPNRFRHLRQLTLRYARWNMRRVHLVDPRTDTVLAPIYPLDKTSNADGCQATIIFPHQRRLEFPILMVRNPLSLGALRSGGERSEPERSEAPNGVRRDAYSIGVGAPLLRRCSRSMLACSAR